MELQEMMIGTRCVLTCSCLVGLLVASFALRAELSFYDATKDAKIEVFNSYINVNPPGFYKMPAGLAAADYDLDGWVDLYVETGNTTPNSLFHNNGDGTFSDLAAQAGVELLGRFGAGPAFADINDDGYPELFVGGIQGTGVKIFLNNTDGTFTDITNSTGLSTVVQNENDFSFAFADVNRDGRLDFFVSHWGSKGPAEHLWINLGDNTFMPADNAYGITQFQPEDFSFTPNFVDLNLDRLPDLVVATDYGLSKAFINNGGQSFVEVTDEVITDENGMGATIGDFNNDGLQDWFVSSIFEQNESAQGGFGKTGNRLYIGKGDGHFIDDTESSGVRDGYFGWGACSGDFNHDGWMDIFHVNGFHETGVFASDPSRLFMNDGDGTFTERSMELGINDTNQGRGVACFDYDRDGDLDIFVSNNNGPLKLYRNDLKNDENNWISLSLVNVDKNQTLIGSVVRVVTTGLTQTRELRLGSNYQSHDPPELHFGLASNEIIDELSVTWPDGTQSTHRDVASNRQIQIFRDGHLVPVCLNSGSSGTEQSKSCSARAIETVPLSFWAMVLIACGIVLISLKLERNKKQAL
jgi:hypothetical protein